MYNAQPAPTNASGDPRRERVAELKIAAPQVAAAEQVANVAAEKAVISVVLNAPDKFPALREHIQPADFYVLIHGFIWHVFDKLANEQAGIDTTTAITALLDYSKHFPTIQNFEAFVNLTITELENAAPNIENAETYARDVRDAALALRLYKVGGEITAIALDRSVSATDKIERTIKIVYSATERHDVVKSDIAAAVETHRADMLANRGNPSQPAITTGFAELDDLIGGFYPGELIIFGGNDGMGKTSALLSMTRAAAKWGAGIFHATGEVKRAEIVSRFVTMGTGIPARALRNKDLTDQQWETYEGELARITALSYFIMDEHPRFTVNQMRAKLQRYTNEGNQIDLIVADGIWLMDSETPFKERWRAVSEITAGLVSLANDFNCPVVAVQQYSAEIRVRKDHKPTKGDFAESAAVRRDAHVMLGLHRESYYDREAVDEDGTQLFCLKYRGEPGKEGQFISLSYDMKRAMYMGTSAADLVRAQASEIEF